MIGPLQNAMRLQAMRVQATQADTRVGIVSSYDPSIFAVRVQVQPENMLTGWLPLASPWIGNGWGMFAAPSVGDMVAVHFFGSDLEAGFVEGRLYNDVDRPVAVPGGELWIQHASGQFVKLLASGALALSDGHGATVTLNGNGTISSTGTWSHTGDITLTGTLTGATDVIGGGKSLKTHVHTGVSTGSSNTGTPL